jgi:hypothetical protein
MDLPNPQPGQNSNPRFASGQIVTCVSLAGLVNASASMPLIQISASKGN